MMKLGTRFYLLLSLVLNVCLVAALLWNARDTPPPFLAPVQTVTARPAPRKQSTPASEKPPFHWRQVESPDFTVYVQNLRAIGCPEATIRDIVKSELDEIYQEKASVAQRTNPSAAFERQLQAEKNQLLASLTSLPPAATGTTQSSFRHASADAASAPSTQPFLAASAARNSNDAFSASDSHSSSAPQKTGGAAASSNVPVVPAAFVYGSAPAQAISSDKGRLVLNDATVSDALPQVQKTTLSEIRSDFVQSLSTSSQTPQASSYRSQWQQAQQESDEHFRLFFGGDAFVRAQIQAVQATLATQGTSPKTPAK